MYATEGVSGKINLFLFRNWNTAGQPAFPSIATIPKGPDPSTLETAIELFARLRGDSKR
jgi:hypothetical protein